MATLAPPQPGRETRSGANRAALLAALRPWRSRFILRRTLRWTTNGVVIGLVLACLMLLASRLVPWNALPWVITALALTLAGAFSAAIYYRPSLARSARLIDEATRLHDRVSTAWEYRDDTSTLAALQRRDALRRMGKHTPAATISLRPGRVRLLAFATVLAAFVLLLFLPNPMNTLLQQQNVFQANIARQVASINHIRNVVDTSGTLPSSLRDKIDNILRDTTLQLQSATNATQAQQILAQAQQKLNALRDSQSPNRQQGNANASSSLQKSSDSNAKALGSALARGDLKGLHNALQKLASQVNSMTAAQRAQLAQQLEQAANAASSDPQLSSALHQLAKAVASGNSSDIADAIKAVENAAAQDVTSQEANSSIDKASQALQNAANALAASSDSSSSQASVQGQSPGQGQNPSQNLPSGQNNTGAGSQGNTGTTPGKNERVFVPGAQSTGSSIVTNDGSNGTVQPGSSVPYAKVLAQYMQMAHDAIDNSNIPPDLKDLVQNYYNSLEGQK